MNNKSEKELFANLVFSGKEAKVKEMIGAGVDLDQINSNGMTPLMTAVEGDQPEILELLLKNGANPNKKSDFYGLTPLHWAVEYAIDGMIQNNKTTPYPEPLECIRILIKYGADLRIKNNSGKMVMDYQMTKEIMNKLVEK